MRISDWSSDVCSSDLAPVSTVLATLKLSRSIRLTILPGFLGVPWLATSSVRESGVTYSWIGTVPTATRSEERRVGTECAVRVDLGGRRTIKKQNKNITHNRQCDRRHERP